MSYKLSRSLARAENSPAVPGRNHGKLHGEQERLRMSSIVNTSEDAILSKTLDGIITTWNPAAERMFGYTAQEIIGKPKTVLFPPDRLQEESDILDRLRRGIPTVQFETVRLRKDGTPIHVSVSISPIRDEENRVVGASTVARDITARKQEDEQVRLLSTGAAESKSGIVITDPQGSVLYVNPAFERISGYALEELRGRRPGDVLQGPETDAGTRAQVRAAIEAEEPIAVEILNYHKNGAPYWIEMHIAPVRDKAGTITHLIAIENDVTSRKRVEAEAETSRRELEMVLESSPDCMTLLDAEGRMVYMNEGGRRLCEIEDFSTAQGRDWLSYWEGEVQSLAHHALEEAFGGRVGRFEGFCPTAKGTPMWWDVILTPLLGEAGQIRQILAVGRDVTEYHRLNEQHKAQMAQIEAQNAVLAGLATTDGLTGLKNHRALQERLREEYHRAVRYNTSLSVLMLDVDSFKQFNDTFGHPAGDAVLRQVAQILRETARGCDFVARYGGEEFAILLPETEAEEAKSVAERFRREIETASWFERAVTISIGVATLAPATPHPDTLLVNADAALYRSKYRGRNCVTHANSLVEPETLDTEAIGWYDSLLEKLLATQAEPQGSATEHVRAARLQAYDTTTVSWSRILGLTDKETEDHSERVTTMMVRLARHLGLNEQEVLFARWGAWLHDIGKVAVPDTILHKPGPLTDEEWAIMREHTTIAYEMLQPVDFLGPAVDIPYCHHEKWDGSGYPRGLKGEEIPLTARQFAVIDVFDALTSDRPYRAAWPQEKVLEYLQAQAGTHFDPQAVDAFLAMLAEGCDPAQMV